MLMVELPFATVNHLIAAGSLIAIDPHLRGGVYSI
jgi:hypothetical protein